MGNIAEESPLNPFVHHVKYVTERCAGRFQLVTHYVNDEKRVLRLLLLWHDPMATNQVGSICKHCPGQAVSLFRQPLLLFTHM